MKEIYRFRNIDTLIYKYKELQNQEIYFASQKELNDPMEGYRDIFWDGDKIIWKNFILNYVKSLEQVYKLYSVILESKRIEGSDIPDLFRLAGPFSIYSKQITKNASDSLFQRPFIAKLPEALSKRTKPVRRNELALYLQFIHPFALNAIATSYHEKGFTQFPLLQNDISAFEKIINSEESLPEWFNRMEADGKKMDFDLFLTQIGRYNQINVLIARNKFVSKIGNENKLFLLYEFPIEYLDKLSDSIYPPWYSASFLSDYKNSALWAHYGNNHNGICLIYRPMSDEDNGISIKLKTEYGYSSEPLIGMTSHKFRKVRYENSPPMIDFFRSIGRLRAFELDQLWYKDPDGERSVCGEHLLDKEKEDIWCEKYWQNFIDSFSIKLMEWSYEQEYRLVVNGDLVDYTNSESRKLKYNFDDLVGIIFGIRCSAVDKLEIMKIIEEKCKEHSRKNFDFYQAYYSGETKQIERFKLPGPTISN